MSIALEAWIRRVAARDLGGVSISIGTSLAIETVAGILPDTVVNVPPIASAQELWINVRTLVRNLHGALDKEAKVLVHPDVVMLAIQEEMSIIEAVIKQASNFKCAVVFYLCQYSSLPKNYPNAIFKGVNTDLQKNYQLLEDTIVQRFSQVPRGEHDIRYFAKELSGDGSVALIITHCVVDLLAKGQFASLRLLESHTGKIKNSNEWSSKLTGGKELTRIPFCKLSLQVFGDGLYFSGHGRKVKQFLLTHAESNKWSPVTQRDKMLYTLQHDKDAFSARFLITML